MEGGSAIGQALMNDLPKGMTWSMLSTTVASINSIVKTSSTLISKAKDLFNIAKTGFIHLMNEIIKNQSGHAGKPKGSFKSSGLSDKDWEDAARNLGVNNPAALKALYKQESGGKAFLKDGRAKILFERHYMYRNLKKRGKTEKELGDLVEKYPNVVNKKSQPKGTYGSYESQYDKMAIARTIDDDAALQSASYGGMQVMGTNYKGLYKNPQEMYEAQQTSEGSQLEFFIHEVKTSHPNLAKKLNAEDWEAAAADYNGSNWKATNPDYAKNLKKYFNEFNKKQ